MDRGSWYGSLMVMTVVGTMGLAGCNRLVMQDTARSSTAAEGAPKLASGCPGAGYHGRLQRDLTQPYASRQYLLDNGTLCRPQP